METNVTIIRADNNDVSLISKLGSETFNNTFGSTCTREDMKQVIQEYFNHDQVTKELNDPSDYFYITFLENEPMGYYRMNTHHQLPITIEGEKKAIELMRFYFKKESHGTGLANQTMLHAINLAKELNYDAIYLSVWEYNFRARGFYEKHGFKNTGVKYPFPLGSTPQFDYWFLKYL